MIRLSATVIRNDSQDKGGVARFYTQNEILLLDNFFIFK